MSAAIQTPPQPEAHHLSKKTVSNSLVGKLAAACDAVGGVGKNGRNDVQNYSYVKAADVAKAIRHELFKRGVMVIPDEKEFVETAKIQTSTGKTIREFRLTVLYTMYDSESQETISVTAYGVAMDSGDKAIYKCKTGAAKYFLRALGLIPDERDDPEADEKVDEETDPRVAAARQAKRPTRSQQTALKNFQVRAWATTCAESGKTAEQQAQFLKMRFGVAMVSELTTDQFDEAIRWAAANESLEKTLTTSVRAARAARKPEPTAPKPPQPIVPALDNWPDHEYGD